MSDAAGGGDGGERALTLFIGGSQSDFIPIRFHAEEAISTPFLLTIDFYATEAQLAPDSYLYQPVSLKVQRPGGPERYFNGMIRKLVSHGTVVRGQTLYTFEVVPKLWFLSQTIDCRIFPNASAGDIFQKIFGEVDLEYSLTVQNSPQTRPYTTQYNETDLDFVTRLMEEEGYYYYFTHSQSAHKLVILDYNNAFQTIDSNAFNVVDTGNNFDVITAFRRLDRTAYGSVTLADYDPETVNTPSTTKSTVLTASGTGSRDVYLWPGHTTDNGLLTNRSQFRAEAADAAAALYEGQGSHEGFVAGG